MYMYTGAYVYRHVYLYMYRHVYIYLDVYMYDMHWWPSKPSLHVSEVAAYLVCFIMSQDPAKACLTQEVERIFLVALSGLWAAGIRSIYRSIYPLKVAPRSFNVTLFMRFLA